MGFPDFCIAETAKPATLIMARAVQCVASWVGGLSVIITRIEVLSFATCGLRANTRHGPFQTMPVLILVRSKLRLLFGFGDGGYRQLSVDAVGGEFNFVASFNGL